jgi:peptidoglycan/LPS O-acetylase OafA/YrhL
MTHFPLNLAGAFLAAGLSYYLVETPILNLRKRLAVPLQRAPQPDASIGLLAEPSGTGSAEI